MLIFKEGKQQNLSSIKKQFELLGHIGDIFPIRLYILIKYIL